ncbi:MAG: glycosyltransferase [Flavobacteriales bacterium]|nr:glycosyltransferase [Flavobacteriales bacterium]
MGTPRILVAPLDWGLGHTTRVIPVVRELLTAGAEVVLGGTAAQHTFLKPYFPLLETLPLNSYNISYRKHAGRDVFFQVPAVLRAIEEERQACAKWVSEGRVDGFISDNRYGVFHAKVPSVIISHQLSIAGPRIAAPFLKRMNRKHLAPFREIWVPDVASAHNLAGKLSHSRDMRVSYLGMLSRFSHSTPIPNATGRPLAIISGPERMRTEFENRVVQQFEALAAPSLIVRGNPQLNSEQHGEVELVPHLADAAMKQAIQEAPLIVCRSGYSTLMDLAALGRRAVLVPTPGQPEQEYLARWFSEQYGFTHRLQSQLGRHELPASTGIWDHPFAFDPAPIREWLYHQFKI